MFIAPYSPRAVASVILSCFVGFLASSYTWAQQNEFESSGNEGFLKRKSFVNREAPDVEVYDENGDSFRLSRSRGKHTVVVFGCLT